MIPYRALLAAAAVYILAAPVMLYADHLASPGAAHAMAWPLAVVATVYFVFCGLYMTIVRRPFMANPRHAVAAVMVSGVLRLLLTVVMLLVYCIACDDYRLVFVINLLVYYLITLVLSGMASGRAGKERKPNASSSHTNE